jgi:hypothetical protein
MLGLAQTQTLTPVSQRPVVPSLAVRHPSLVTRHCLIPIGTPILETELTRSQQARKHFPVATFFSILAPAPRLTHHSSLIPRRRLASFLFNTNKAHKIIILMRTLMKTKEKRFSIKIIYFTKATGRCISET